VNSLVVALIASIALASCSARSEVEACGVYRAFFAQLPAPGQQVLHARSEPEIMHRNGAHYDAPRRFERGAGVMEPPGRAPPEFLYENTATYFSQLQNEPAIDVAGCFPDGAPRFVQQSDVDAVMDRLETPNSDVLSVWTLSPIAIAPDGRHALMLGGMVCGGLCGGGAFYLFEKTGQSWMLVGHDNLWVS